MVLNNLAAFRPPAQHHQDLAALARARFQTDLTQEDRDVLRSATETVRRAAYVGSLAGLGVGCLLAYRARALRRHWLDEVLRAARASGKPEGAQGAQGGKLRDWPVKVVLESGKTRE